MALRAGLVGTGHWARTVHAPGLAAHPAVEFAGVWGRDPEKARSAAEPFGVAAFDDFEQLLTEVDLLAFAVPPALQAELALRAARAGKHLFLEKPIALDVAAADALVTAVDEAGVSTLVFFTQRFVPTWENWLVDTIAARPSGGRADWFSRQDAGSPYADSRWRRERGALWDVAPHLLSQLIPALGPVTDVAGARGEHDLVHLVLTHEGGRTSRMSASLSMPPGTTRVSIEFYTDGGWLIQPEDPRDMAATYANALGELLDNIVVGETAHRCDVRFGREVVEVLARCEDALT